MDYRNHRYKRGFTSGNKKMRHASVKPVRAKKLVASVGKFSNSARNYYKNEKSPVKGAIIISATIVLCLIVVFGVRACNEARRRNVDVLKIWEDQRDAIYEKETGKNYQDTIDELADALEKNE